MSRAQRLAHLSPKGRGALGISIRDKALGNAMVSEHSAVEQMCYVLSRDLVTRGLTGNHIGSSVDKYHNRSARLPWRQLGLGVCV
eukprot:250845-Chlamydomonas_euryale.AAC.1